MKKIQIFSLTVSILLISLLTSCEYGIDEFLWRDNNIDRRAENIIDLPIEEAPPFPYEEAVPPSQEKVPLAYDVLIVTDVHFGAENSFHPRPEEKLFKKLDKLKEEGSLPLFCICLGDIAEHGLEKEISSYQKKLVEELENRYSIKTYTTVGNHDLYNSGWSPYKKIVYPHTSFYRFSSHSFNYYFLDTASGTLGNRQYKALLKEFKNDGKKKLVFTHVPFYADGYFYFSMQNSEERNKLISIFTKSKVKGLFCGHLHKEVVSDLGSFTEYTIGGFLSYQEYAILSVDEQNAAYKLKFMDLKD